MEFGERERQMICFLMANSHPFAQLPFSTRWQELKDLFKGFNFNPTHADIMLENGTTRSKGCGTVRFASVEEAEKAIAQVNGAEFGGRNLIVRFDKFS